MKRKLQIIIGASAVTVLAFSTLAQDPPKPNSDKPAYTRERMPHAGRPDQLNDAAKASDIIGMAVKNNQDQRIGKVDEVAVDVESGRIVQVIMSIGGFVDIGDTQTAVPPGAFRRDISHKALRLDADKEKLKAAPKFEMSNWAECSDSAHLSAVYRYYGEDPSLRFISAKEADENGARNIESTPNTFSTRNADGTWNKDRVSNENQSMIPASRLSQIQKASKLMGTWVKNMQDEKLGKVENILLDLPSGRIVAVVVSSGGFLGINDELSAVPPTALRFTSDRETLQLNSSKEMLSNAPHFKSNQWPDFAQGSYSDGVYRAYRVQPYFTTQAAIDRDNTVRNARDGNSQTLTAQDQGTSRADVATTAQIRKEIIAEKNMSVNGRNVKIITNNGQVTLRGPVDTAEEKRLIGEIANRIASLENVDNQLEVKLTTSSN